MQRFGRHSQSADVPRRRRSGAGRARRSRQLRRARFRGRRVRARSAAAHLSDAFRTRRRSGRRAGSPREVAARSSRTSSPACAHAPSASLHARRPRRAGTPAGAASGRRSGSRRAPAHTTRRRGGRACSGPRRRAARRAGVAARAAVRTVVAVNAARPPQRDWLGPQSVLADAAAARLAAGGIEWSQRPQARRKIRRRGGRRRRRPAPGHGGLSQRSTGAACSMFRAPHAPRRPVGPGRSPARAVANR